MNFGLSYAYITGVTISSFYGKQEETEDSSTESRDLVSTLKSRRLMAVRAAQEKQKREEEDRTRRAREAVVQKTEKEKEMFERQLMVGAVV